MRTVRDWPLLVVPKNGRDAEAAATHKRAAMLPTLILDIPVYPANYTEEARHPPKSLPLKPSSPLLRLLSPRSCKTLKMIPRKIDDRDHPSLLVMHSLYKEITNINE